MCNNMIRLRTAFTNMHVLGIPLDYGRIMQCPHAPAKLRAHREEGICAVHWARRCTRDGYKRSKGRHAYERHGCPLISNQPRHPEGVRSGNRLWCCTAQLLRVATERHVGMARPALGVHGAVTRRYAGAPRATRHLERMQLPVHRRTRLACAARLYIYWQTAIPMIHIWR